MTIEKILTVFIYIILLIKIVIIIATLGHILISHFFNTIYTYQLLDLKLTFWEKKSEFVYNILMSILLIFIFNPWQNEKKYISNEISFLLYMFGFILIITSDWGLFFKESKLFQQITDAIKL